MKWRALILGGGGSTGEFQFDALQVIAQHYDSFSVGSLNTGVLALYTYSLDRYSSNQACQGMRTMPSGVGPLSGAITGVMPVPLLMGLDRLVQSKRNTSV